MKSLYAHDIIDDLPLSGVLEVVIFGKKFPREDAGGLSREYVLRIPSVS